MAPLDAFEGGRPCAGGLSAAIKGGDGAAIGLFLAWALTLGSLPARRIFRNGSLCDLLTVQKRDSG